MILDKHVTRKYLISEKKKIIKRHTMYTPSPLTLQTKYQTQNYFIQMFNLPNIVLRYSNLGQCRSY